MVCHHMPEGGFCPSGTTVSLAGMPQAGVQSRSICTWIASTIFFTSRSFTTVEATDDGYLDHVLLLSPREMCGASMEERPQAGHGRHQPVRTRTAHRTCRASSSDGSGLAA